MSLFNKFIQIITLTLLLAPISHANNSWRFKVFYDDTEIGEHIFKTSSIQNKTNVTIVAEFNVKVFFINAYNYQHTNYETWNGECLSSIYSSTDDNGEQQYVKGQADKDNFIIKTASGDNTINKNCIKSFSYWDVDILQSKQLLNSQTGELTPVDISFVSREDLIVRGIPTKTKRYVLKTKEFTIDLWYSNNNEWVALNSTTADGTNLRYQIQ